MTFYLKFKSTQLDVVWCISPCSENAVMAYNLLSMIFVIEVNKSIYSMRNSPIYFVLELVYIVI